MTKTTNYQPLIERLKNERKEYLQRSYEQGHAEGLTDAENVSLSDFEMIYGRANGVDNCDYVALSDDTEYWEKQEEHRVMQLPDMDMYFKGWFTAVLSVWKEIEPMVMVSEANCDPGLVVEDTAGLAGICRDPAETF
jgi:hypothetical protein